MKYYLNEKPVTLKKQRIWMSKIFKCKRCGRCCLKFGFERPITTDDILRWRAKGRTDILDWVYIYEKFKNPVGDAWFDPKTREPVNRCPWLEKLPNEKYLCKIYKTRPQTCKEFSPESPNPEIRKDAEDCNCQGLNKDEKNKNLA